MLYCVPHPCCVLYCVSPASPELCAEPVSDFPVVTVISVVIVLLWVRAVIVQLYAIEDVPVWAIMGGVQEARPLCVAVLVCPHAVAHHAGILRAIARKLRESHVLPWSTVTVTW